MPIRKNVIKKIKIVYTIAIVLLVVGFGCKKEKIEISPEVASSDEALFKLGEKYIKKDPEKAQLYFRQVIDSFPKSFYAQRAKLSIADIYFKKGDEGNLIVAASEYREFISLFPLSPSSSYAQYRIAMTYFKKILAPGRDQTKTNQALDEFKKVITNYPMSEEAKSSQENIKLCEEYLAEHTCGIGYYYYKVHVFKASISRLSEILTKYPNYSKMDKVYFYLGDSYLKWNKADQSIPYFTKLISDFPQSKYAKNAVEIMKEIEKEQEGKKK